MYKHSSYDKTRMDTTSILNRRHNHLNSVTEGDSHSISSSNTTTSNTTSGSTMNTRRTIFPTVSLKKNKTKTRSNQLTHYDYGTGTRNSTSSRPTRTSTSTRSSVISSTSTSASASLPVAANSSSPSSQWKRRSVLEQSRESKVQKDRRRRFQVPYEYLPSSPPQQQPQPQLVDPQESQSKSLSYVSPRSSISPSDNSSSSPFVYDSPPIMPKMDMDTNRNMNMNMDVEKVKSTSSASKTLDKKERVGGGEGTDYLHYNYHRTKTNTNTAKNSAMMTARTESKKTLSPSTLSTYSTATDTGTISSNSSSPLSTSSITEPTTVNATATATYKKGKVQNNHNISIPTLPTESLSSSSSSDSESAVLRIATESTAAQIPTPSSKSNPTNNTKDVSVSTNIVTPTNCPTASHHGSTACIPTTCKYTSSASTITTMKSTNDSNTNASSTKGQKGKSKSLSANNATTTTTTAAAAVVVVTSAQSTFNNQNEDDDDDDNNNNTTNNNTNINTNTNASANSNKKTNTLEKRLFHALHTSKVSNPSIKEFKESWAFANAVKKFYSPKNNNHNENDNNNGIDLVLDVAGGHGALGALLLILLKSTSKSVVIDPACDSVRGGVEKAWGNEIFSAAYDREERKELKYRNECLRTGLRDELEEAIHGQSPISPKRILVVACHACQHLSDETLEIACSYGVNVTVMPCCQKDLTNGSFKAAAKQLGMNIGVLMDILAAGKVLSWNNGREIGVRYEVKMKIINESITPQNRMILAKAVDLNGDGISNGGDSERVKIKEAHERLSRAYHKAHSNAKRGVSRFGQKLRASICVKSLGAGIATGVILSTVWSRKR